MKYILLNVGKRSRKFNVLKIQISLYLPIGGNEVTRIEVTDADEIEPFNRVSLRVIGDDSAPSYFNVVENTRIIIRPNVDLATDRETEYTLRIEAQDLGTPPRSSTATVQITVIRNLNPPKFLTNNVRVTIPDNMAPGSSITTVQAEDSDREAPNKGSQRNNKVQGAGF